MLAVSMAALVAPVVVGREQGWPGWVALAVTAAGVGGLAAFHRYERRLAAGGGAPLVDLRVLRVAGVRPGLLACFVVMGCYAAFLFTLTLHLQNGLGFGPLLAGVAFVPFPVGFAAVSLGANRLPPAVRAVLPVAGPLVFATAGVLLAVLVAAGDGWSWPAVPLLLFAGAGHAAAFSPLFARILASVDAAHAGTVSGMGPTGTLLAGVLGVAVVGSVYLAVAGGDPGRSAAGFGAATAIVAACLVAGAVSAGLGTRRMTRPARTVPPGSPSGRLRETATGVRS